MLRDGVTIHFRTILNARVKPMAREAVCTFSRDSSTDKNAIIASGLTVKSNKKIHIKCTHNRIMHWQRCTNIKVLISTDKPIRSMFIYILILYNMNSILCLSKWWTWYRANISSPRFNRILRMIPATRRPRVFCLKAWVVVTRLGYSGLSMAPPSTHAPWSSLSRRVRRNRAIRIQPTTSCGLGSTIEDSKCSIEFTPNVRFPELMR